MSKPVLPDLDPLVGWLGSESVLPLLDEEGRPIAWRCVPADREALRQLVLHAQEERLRIRVSDRRDQLAHPREYGGLRISLQHMARPIEHARADLVLRAEAGLSVAAADAIVRPAGQRMALCPPRAAHVSLGTVIARAIEGPGLHRLGALRDSILGIEILHGDGRFTRSGGQVVKNVSGYDLCRLMTGSRGRFGIITEVTLRLRGRPQAQSMLAFPGRFADDEELFALGGLIRERVPSHAGLFLARGAAAAAYGGDKLALLVVLEGAPEHLAALESELSELSERPAERLQLDAINDLSRLFDQHETRMEVGLLPSRLGALDQLLQACIPQAPSGFTSLLDLETGFARVGLAGPWPLDELAETTFGQALIELGAAVDIPTDPHFPSRRDRNFGRIDDAPADLSRAIATSLDPKGVFARPHTA